MATAARRKTAGRGGAWKKSPLVAVAAAAVIVLVWVYILWPSGGGSRYVLKNVEFVYIPQSAAEIDFKNPPEQVILRYDTDKAPQIPFEHPAGSGTWLWDAFECQNGECPYAKQQQKPLVYSNFNAKLLEYAKAGRPTQPGPDGGPGFDPAMEMDIGMAICPVCKTGGGKQIRTPERAAKDQELHERVMRENS